MKQRTKSVKSVSNNNKPTSYEGGTTPNAMEAHHQNKMLKVMFAKIKFSVFSILIDPLISYILFPWRYTNCCVSFSR